MDITLTDIDRWRVWTEICPSPLQWGAVRCPKLLRLRHLAQTSFLVAQASAGSVTEHAHFVGKRRWDNSLVSTPKTLLTSETCLLFRRVFM